MKLENLMEQNVRTRTSQSQNRIFGKTAAAAVGTDEDDDNYVSFSVFGRTSLAYKCYETGQTSSLYIIY